MNKLLVLVDYQNDFVTGSLGSKEAQAIENKIVEKIKNHDGMILTTLDTHNKDYLDTREGMALPVEHCVAGTKGWRITNKVTDALHDVSLSKPLTVYYAIKKTFAPMMKELQMAQEADEIELIGVCTDICILSTAITMHTLNHNADIIIDASCCAGTTVENHNKALDIMQNSLLMKVINRENVKN